MNSVKKVLVYVLVAVLAFTCIPPAGVSAAEKTKSDVQAAVFDDDGLLLRQYSDFAGTYGNKKTVYVDSGSLKHNSKFNNFVVEDGVDISHHNGVVNWKKVKDDGVEFAIIRMAYRGYASKGTIKPDNYAITNLEGAKAAGLQVGVYFFSQATTVAEAKEEANYILNMIKGYNIDLPVVIDYEYTAKSENGRLWAAKQNGMTDRQRTNACLAFCETVEAAGYDAMLYADKNMLENDLFADEIDAKYEIWLAHWTTKTSYENDYTYWQYTSDGSVNGVPSERVDLNVRYTSAPFRITSCTDTTMTMEWRPIDGAEGYVIYRQIEDGLYKKVAQIDDPAVTTYTDTELITNTVYSYFVRYYTTDENGQQTIHKSGFPAQKSVTALKLQKLTVAATATGADSIKLTWAKEPNAQGYTVQQYSDTSGKYTTIATVTVGDTEELITTGDSDVEILEDGTVIFTTAGLVAGAGYQYRVRAFADVGGARVYGSYSTPTTVNTTAKLAKPVVTAKGYSYTSNKLSWKAIAGATGYQVQRYNASTKKWVTLKTVSGTAFTNIYLNCNTTYKYRVRAIAKSSKKTVYSSYSVVKSAKTKGSRIGVVKEGPLNIRTGPGTGYKKLIQVKKGKQLTITGSTAKWYRVKIKVNGKYRVGYASKTYVKLK